MRRASVNMQRSLRNLIVKDSLTDLYNRRYCNQNLKNISEQYIKTGEPYTLAIADIDFFKKVNDTYGHTAGDEVLVRVMPIKTDNDEIMNYAHEIVDALEAKNVRVELDDRAEKLGYRMREGQIQKVPYLLVIGFNEQENKTVSYRLHGQQDTTTLGLDEFVEKIDTEIKNKAR